MTAQPNQSLIEGLACLRALSMAQESIGTRELARQLDLNVMRVNRLLKTLADIGLAQQDQKRRYHIGPGIHTLAAQAMFGSGLLRQALPLLRELGGPGHVVGFGVLWRDQVTFLYHGSHGSSVEDALGKVNLYPAGRSSVGMALLAQQSDAALKVLWENGPIQGQTDWDDFIQTIETIREAGYAALELGNSSEKHISLAISIGSPAFAGVALSGLPLKSDVAPYVAELKALATQLS